MQEVDWRLKLQVFSLLQRVSVVQCFCLMHRVSVYEVRFCFAVRLHLSATVLPPLCCSPQAVFHCVPDLFLTSNRLFLLQSSLAFPVTSHTATMRRFSSEGSLLDLDFLPWKKVALKNPDYEKEPQSGIYTPQTETGEQDRKSMSLTPTIVEPGGGPSMARNTKEHSISTENLNELSKLDKGHLVVCALSEGCRAYSDGQLAPASQGSTENMERNDPTPPSPFLFGTFPAKSRHHHRAKLSAAKLHLKSLFGQSPHSSHSNLTNAEHKDSVSERRSRLLFMRQWSQVGPSKTRVSREELDEWAQSLDDLLASRSGVSVFEAFLRSEFSEENLQFYLACEQYKHSSNNFSLQRRAKDICATYIQPGAPREVNLDSKTRDLTLQLLQAPSHTSLAYAQRRIYSLLDLDCYPRFLQSSMYLSLKASRSCTPQSTPGGTTTRTPQVKDSESL